MKPFNLQEALAGKPVVTRDGRKVQELHYFKNRSDNCKICLIINGGTQWTTINGKIYDDLQSCNDLFMAEEEIIYYSNICSCPRSNYKEKTIEECINSETKCEDTLAVQKTTINPDTGDVKVEIVYKY